MKLLKDIRRRSTLPFLRRASLSKESNLSVSSDSSIQRNEPASMSTPELTPNESAVESSTSSTSASPPPSEILMTESHDGQPTDLSSSTPEAMYSEITTPQGPAPVIDNLTFGQPVSNQIISLQGHIPSAQRLDGTLYLHHVRGQIPSTSWPVSQSKFKALAYLQCGLNQFAMEFVPAGSRNRYHSSFATRYHPMTSCAPIKLALICAKDSKYLEDESEEGTTELSIAAAKYRMTAYLWQAFIAEKMGSRENQRRSFQLENDWGDSTLYSEDFHTGEMRNQAPIHIVSLDETIEELNGLTDLLFAEKVEKALKKRFNISKSQISNFACMFMDTEWDSDKQTQIRGFSYGGPGISDPDRIGLAIYGAHLLSTYPSSIDRVTASFSDEKPTIGFPESTKWKCATRGIGNHLKLVGHMLGLPEQSFGMMSEESCCISGLYSMYASQHIFEPRLHPLDMVRLRHHPAFQSPFAPLEKQTTNCSPSFWGQKDNAVFISSRTGMLAIEVFTSSDTVCHHWISLLDGRGQPRYTHSISFAEILKLSSPKSNRYSTFNARHGPYNIHILTADGKSTQITDFEAFAKRLCAPDMNGKIPMYKSQAIGLADETAQKEQILFPSGARMRGMTVFHSPGAHITGVEFMFEDQKVMFGKRDGEAHKEWRLNMASGEVLMGIDLCVKETLRGLRLFTSSGRWSPWFGDATAGTEYKLVPPPTYHIVGVEGHVGESISSLQFIVAR